MAQNSPREIIDWTLQKSGWGDLEKLERERWIDCQPPFEKAHYIDGFKWPDGKFRFKPDWPTVPFPRTAGVFGPAAEMPALLPGGQAAAVGGTILAMLADLTSLAWIQVRLSLMIAAAYGHDLADGESRAKEILALHGLDTAIGTSAAPATGKALSRIARRLILRHLRGPSLQALKAMFRFVGIRFSRAALLRGLPAVNIPAGLLAADVTTRRSAGKARAYYRTLPKVPPKVTVPQS